MCRVSAWKSNSFKTLKIFLFFTKSTIIYPIYPNNAAEKAVIHMKHIRTTLKHPKKYRTKNYIQHKSTQKNQHRHSFKFILLSVLWSESGGHACSKMLESLSESEIIQKGLSNSDPKPLKQMFSLKMLCTSKISKLSKWNFQQNFFVAKPWTRVWAESHNRKPTRTTIETKSVHQWL